MLLEIFEHGHSTSNVRKCPIEVISARPCVKWSRDCPDPDLMELALSFSLPH